MSIYYFKPNLGGQTDAFTSLKDVMFVDGANQSGKSTVLTRLIVASMVPHPDSKGYSYYPCLPDFNADDPWDNRETAALREIRRFKLPTHNWLIAPDGEMHRWVAMQELPELLNPYLDHKKTKWSKQNKGIWDTIQLLPKYGGSILSLKSWMQWVNNRHVFTGARLDNIFIDEPFPEGLFGEFLMRTATKQGRVVITATLVDDDSDDPMSREAEWMEERFIVPSEQGDLPDNIDVINIPLSDNPHINYLAFESRLALLDESEQSIRGKGRRRRRHGRPYFNREKIEELLERATDPLGEGYLLDGIIVDDLPPKAPDVWYRIWEYPNENQPGYLIAVDPADGGHSANDIVVYGTYPFRMVASMNGRYPEDEIPAELIKLCQWYGGTDLLDGSKWDGGILENDDEVISRLLRVIVGIETNKVKTSLSAMQRGYSEMGVYPPLPRLYYMPTKSTLGRDMHFPGKALGWYTDSITRPYLLAGAKSVITQALTQKTYEIIPCRETLDELWGVVDVKGKYQAPKNKRDDRVMTLGIIRMMAKQYHFKTPEPDKKEHVDSPFIIRIDEGATFIPPKYEEQFMKGRIRYG